MKRGARSGIGIVGAAAYAAALLVFGLPGLGGANHTISVSDEQEYRDALDVSGADTAPHTINVLQDITIEGSMDPTYTGTENLTINGNGFTLDGDDNSRVLNHDSSADLTIDDLVVTGGSTASTGGGIRAVGPMTVTNSTISGNTSSGGGGIRAVAPVTVTNSTISGNTATGDGGGINAVGSVTLTNSTVSGNTADIDGGGIDASGSVTVTNSTVSGNTADTGGGGIDNFGSVTLTHATVVENSAPSGANLEVSDDLTSFGSVVALPQGGGLNCDVIGGTTISQGYNYSDDASCGFTDPTTDTEGGDDPQLGALANNGGPTQTRLPQAGSPLIDAIPVADCHDEVTDDQRGVDRPQDGNEDGTLACDIGAVEVQPGEDDNGDGRRAPAADPVEGRPRFTG